MTLQMLMQIPLLTLAGWLIAPRISSRAAAVVARWNDGGVPGLLLASLTGLLWMLPRMMDSSVQDPGMALAKFSSVPLLIGMPLALSWPRAGFVVRGVLLLEVTATAFRLGWLYLAAPERLCASYLLSDQQRLGGCLLAVGMGISLGLVWKLMWGRFKVDPVGV
ncbi:MAG: hypothetical protein R2909_03305 [Gemmatimonadales bacterium]